MSNPLAEMPSLSMVMNVEGEWSDMTPERRVEPVRVQFGALPGGMASGAASISMRMDLPDGRIVFWQTSLALLLTAADAFKAKYGDPRK
jgi:hypothetical protein